MAYFDKHGVEFSDDKKILILCPASFHGTYSIPEGVTEISEWAFHNRKGVVSIETPESLLKIGEVAFTGCENLRRIFISKSVKEIGKHAFDNIGSSLYIEVDKQNEYFYSEHGCLYTKDKSILIHVCDKDGNVYFVPEGVKTIACCAFLWANMRYVVLPKSLEKIDAEAFLSASIKGLYLQHTYPYKIEIGEDAFDDCAEYCILNIPQGADSTAYNYHPVFEKFKAILFWDGVNL